MQRIVYSKEVNKSVTATMKKKGEKNEKIIIFFKYYGIITCDEYSLLC